MKTILKLISLSIILITTKTFAILPKDIGIFGTEKSQKILQNGDINCYEYKDYYVIEKGHGENVGKDILVKYKNNMQKIACEYRVANGDYEVKNEFAAYFHGIRENLIFLLGSTGPGPEELIIHNLKKRKIVYKNFGSDFKIGNGSLFFWKETGKANQKNCSDYNKLIDSGLRAAIENKVKLNLNTFKITTTKESRCAARQ